MEANGSAGKVNVDPNINVLVKLTAQYYRAFLAEGLSSREAMELTTALIGKLAANAQQPNVQKQN